MSGKDIGTLQVLVGIVLTLLMCKGIDVIFYAYLAERIRDWQAIALGAALILGSVWTYLMIIFAL